MYVFYEFVFFDTQTLWQNPFWRIVECNSFQSQEYFEVKCTYLHICYIEYCPPLPNITAAVYNDSSCLQADTILQGTACQVHCDEGYYQVGKNEFICQIDSTWDYTNFTECISEFISMWESTI